MVKRPAKGIDVIIVGAGGQGLVVCDALLRAGDAGGGDRPIGFVDDAPAIAGTQVAGFPVFGPVAALASIEHDAITVAIGDNGVRRELTERLTLLGERVVSVIHPSVTIARDIETGSGWLISPGVIVTPAVSIGDGVLLNTGAVVEHQSRIGSFAHIGPGAVVGANCVIGDEATIGLGARVLGGVRIGARTIVGAGAVVVRDLPADVVACGVPARVTRSLS